MTCTTCGGEQAADRNDHLCDRDVQPTGFRPPNPPSWGWRALTLGVLGVAAVYLGASIVNLVVMLQDYWLVTGFQADPSSVSVPEIVARMERSDSVSTLAWFALLAHLGTYLVWSRATRTAVEDQGGDPRQRCGTGRSPPGGSRSPRSSCSPS